MKKFYFSRLALPFFIGSVFFVIIYFLDITERISWSFVSVLTVISLLSAGCYSAVGTYCYPVLYLPAAAAGFLSVLFSLFLSSAVFSAGYTGILPDKIDRMEIFLTSDASAYYDNKWQAEGMAVKSSSSDMDAVSECSLKVRLISAGNWKEHFSGEKLICSGKLLKVKSPGNIYFFYSSNAVSTGWRKVYSYYRVRLIHRIERGFISSGNEATDFLDALLLGRKTGKNSGLMLSLKNAGCSHLLALSGFHVGIISLIILKTFTPVFGMRFSAVLSMTAAVLFLLLAGFRASLVSAVLMYLFWMSDKLRHIHRKTIYYLFLPFYIQIILFPDQIKEISFILSYLAITGILFGNSIISILLERYIPYKVDFLLKTAAAGAGVQIFILPAVIFFFGRWRPAGFFATPVLSVLVTLIMISGIINFIIPIPLIINKLLDLLTAATKPFSILPSVEIHVYTAIIISFTLVSVILIIFRRISNNYKYGTEPRLPGLNPVGT